MIKFEDVTKEEMLLVNQIVSRAGERDANLDRLSLNMDLTATHVSGCPLDFAKLLEADDFNFWHDIAGIMARIDRETGKLTMCFLPRCSRQEAH